MQVHHDDDAPGVDHDHDHYIRGGFGGPGHRFWAVFPRPGGAAGGRSREGAELPHVAADPAAGPEVTAASGVAPRRMGRVVGVVGVAAVLLIAVGATWWFTGGRWMSVASPSMGQAAPVGTVVFTRPVTTAELHLRDIISFRSPVNPGEIYTHRVVAIDPAGAVHTKGDINGAPDPSALHTRDIIGKVVARWWAVGWLIRALPILLIGGLLLWAATRRWANQDWRSPLRVFGGSLLFAVAAYVLRPFVGFLVLAKMPTVTGTDMTLVSTGILPIRLTATGGSHLDLVDGQLGMISVTGGGGPHGYSLTSSLHLNLWWWLVLLGIWLTPLLPALLTRRPRLSSPTEPPTDPRHDDGHPHFTGEPGGETAAIPAASAHTNFSAPATAAAVSKPTPRWRRATRWARRRPGPARTLLLVAAAALIAAVVAPSTAAALTARITNTSNTAASANYFTCAAAARAFSPFLSYPLNDAATASGKTAADVSGNTRTGTYGANIAHSASNACSTRDSSGSIVLSGTGTTTSVQTPTQVNNPQVFTETIRFKTTTGGGRLIGFGNVATGTSANYDRHLYLTDTGQVVFGIYNNAIFTAISPGTYLDGNWHQATATLSAAGMILYLDGAQVATNPATIAQNFTGYWRIGYDNLSGWGTIQPTRFYYTGNLAYAAVYTAALTPAQVQALYLAGT